MVVVVGVVVVVGMVVDGFGLVVVGEVVGVAVGGGRVESGGEVGLGVALDPAVVLAILGLLVVAASTWLPPSVAGSTLEWVVVGPIGLAPEAVGSWPAGLTVVLEGKVRSAPVNSSQADPQPAPWLISTTATPTSRTAVSEIADSPTRRRSRQLPISPTTCVTTPPQLPRRDLALPARVVRGRTDGGWVAGSGVGGVGPDPANAAESS